MKNLVESFLVWALGKLNITRLRDLTVDNDRVTIGYSKFLPDDGKWHNVHVSTSFWIKRGKELRARSDNFAEVAIHLDNKEKAIWKLDMPQSSKVEIKQS